MAEVGLIVTYCAILIATVAGVGLINYWVTNFFDRFNPMTAIENIPEKIQEGANKVLNPVKGVVSAGLNQVASVPSDLEKVPEILGNITETLGNITGTSILPSFEAGTKNVANLIGKLPAHPVSSVVEHLPAVPHLKLPSLPVAMPTLPKLPSLPKEIPGKNLLSSFQIGR